MISSVKTDLKVRDEITLFPGKIRNSHQACHDACNLNNSFNKDIMV